MAKKKRFHQSMKDRRDESNGMDQYNARRDADRMDERRGMERYIGMERMRKPSSGDRLGEEFYAGLKLRTKTETRDYNMLSEDPRAIANMPQEVIMKQYPKVDYASYEGLNDTINMVDFQMRQDSKRQKRGPYPEKY